MYNPPRRRPKNDEGPSDDWVVTFSDCMTLLLAFFVMLLSFSAFSPTARTRVQDVWEAMANPSSVSLQDRLPRESPVMDDEAEIDRTENGTETRPPDDRLDPTLSPRRPQEPLGDDAYCDRKVWTVPSDVLFWGRGDGLKPQARDLLGHIANYLRLVPCRVVVCETSAPPSARPVGLARAWAVARHLMNSENLEADRFAISLPADAAGHKGEPVVRITMLNPRTYP